MVFPHDDPREISSPPFSLVVRQELDLGIAHPKVLTYVLVDCQGHSSLDAPSELNPPQRIPSPLFFSLLVPQAEV